MHRLSANHARRATQRGFTLIELVVVLAILGILLALAVPRYIGFRKRAFKGEVANILGEAKTLSWAYYQEREIFPTGVGDIGLQMPVGSAWNTPGVSAGGSGSLFATWTSSGLAGGAPVEPGDLCSVTISTGGNSSQGCTF